MLHGDGSGNMYSAEDGQAEMGALDTEHVPTLMAAFVVIAGGTLFFLKKAGFRFVVEANAGGR